MALKKYSILQKKGDESRPRLDHFLASRLPEAIGRPISKSLVRKLIVAGAVYLNGTRVRIASKPVFGGAKIDLHIDFEKLEKPNGYSAAFSEEKFAVSSTDILFEDEDLIVVTKPAGLPTQPTIDKARNNFYSAVKTFLNQREGHEVYVGLHHRLDKDTSGLLLFTKSLRANIPVADMFQQHTIVKTYLAQAQNAGKLPEAGESFVISNFLKRDPESKNKMSKYTATLSGGLKAETRVTVVAKSNGRALIQAQPFTGRTHQIRVHMSEFGSPIVGDFLYGGRPEANQRLMLHAWILEFVHPFSGAKMRIEATPPKSLQPNP